MSRVVKPLCPLVRFDGERTQCTHKVLENVDVDGGRGCFSRRVYGEKGLTCALK